MRRRAARGETVIQPRRDVGSGENQAEMSGVRLISSLRAPPLAPRRPPRSEQAQSPKAAEGDAAFPFETSRRSASLSLLSLAAIPALAISEWCPPAAAFSLGICKSIRCSGRFL